MNNHFYGAEGQIVTKAEIKLKQDDELNWETTFLNIVKSFENATIKENPNFKGIDNKVDQSVLNLSAISFDSKSIIEPN